jgi:phage protein D
MGEITSADTTSTTYINIATVTAEAQAAATSATTSATSAATSATSAAASATAAATSATSAATSATAAATSAASAAASATQAAGYIPAITAGVTGYFLSNNGTIASWTNLSDWGTV